jgi:hypothetical protein
MILVLLGAIFSLSTSSCDECPHTLLLYGEDLKGLTSSSSSFDKSSSLSSYFLHQQQNLWHAAA